MVDEAGRGSLYDLVLFDLDNTLSDFASAQAEAFPALLAEFDIPLADDSLAIFAAGADPLWRMLERGETTLDTLNVERFQRFVEAVDLDADVVALAARYLELLAISGRLVDGATEVLDALAGSVQVGMVTNGYAEVQRPRLERFGIAHHFDPIVVSSEIGAAKPSAAFFDVALEAAGRPDPARVLVVGDSLASDIAGAAAAGMGTCWFNPTGSVAPVDAPRLDHVVTRLADVHRIVLA